MECVGEIRALSNEGWATVVSRPLDVARDGPTGSKCCALLLRCRRGRRRSWRANQFDSRRPSAPHARRAGWRTAQGFSPPPGTAVARLRRFLSPWPGGQDPATTGLLLRSPQPTSPVPAAYVPPLARGGPEDRASARAKGEGRRKSQCPCCADDLKRRQSRRDAPWLAGRAVPRPRTRAQPAPTAFAAPGKDGIGDNSCQAPMCFLAESIIAFGTRPRQCNRRESDARKFLNRQPIEHVLFCAG